MTCHIEGSSILCRRIDGFARGSIVSVEKDADADSRLWSTELLARFGPPVGWIEWLQSYSPGGGSKTLDEILSAMERRKVCVIGLSVVPRMGTDLERLIRFYERRGFVLDATCPPGMPTVRPSCSATAKVSDEPSAHSTPSARGAPRVGSRGDQRSRDMGRRR